MSMRVWQTRPVNNSEWTAADDAVACLLPMSARNNRILHIDGDSFFASCEIALDPKLEGRPVWVGGGRRGDGIVIAANRLAKKFGIKTARPVSRRSGFVRVACCAVRITTPTANCPARCF